MDLGRLAAHGQLTTRAAWSTNPVRRVLWWLIALYFRGTERELTFTWRSRVQRCQMASRGRRSLLAYLQSQSNDVTTRLPMSS